MVKVEKIKRAFPTAPDTMNAYIAPLNPSNLETVNPPTLYPAFLRTLD